MPFCSQCGNPVDAAAPFCGSVRRPPGGGNGRGIRRSARTRFPGLTPRTVSILLDIPDGSVGGRHVVLPWSGFATIASFRFHAFQALYLFVAWLLNNFVVSWIPWPPPHVRIHELVSLALVAMSIFMMVKAAHEQAYSLPLFGELAARSVEEH